MTKILCDKIRPLNVYVEESVLPYNCKMVKIKLIVEGGKIWNEDQQMYRSPTAWDSMVLTP
jgi:hypothetical protein